MNNSVVKYTSFSRFLYGYSVNEYSYYGERAYHPAREGHVAARAVPDGTPPAGLKATKVPNAFLWPDRGGLIFVKRSENYD